MPHLNAQETIRNYNVTVIPKIEQLPANAKDPNAPNASNGKSTYEAAAGQFGLSKTGNYILLLALALMVVALAALAYMAACQRKRRNLACGEAATPSDTETPADSD